MLVCAVFFPAGLSSWVTLVWLHVFSWLEPKTCKDEFFSDTWVRLIRCTWRRLHVVVNGRTEPAERRQSCVCVSVASLWPDRVAAAASTSCSSALFAHILQGLCSFVPWDELFQILLICYLSRSSVWCLNAGLLRILRSITNTPNHRLHVIMINS